MRRVSIAGQLSISRHSDDTHIIRVTVRNPGTVVELECSAEDLALALTGRAGLPCTVTLNLDRLQTAIGTTETPGQRPTPRSTT